MLINTDYEQTEHFIGFGCMLSWFYITKYFANTKDYTVLSRTFSLAIPLVLKVMLGTIPVLIGLTLAGKCFFWPMRGYFDSVPNSLFTLFCAINGDSVGDIFKGTS